MPSLAALFDTEAMAPQGVSLLWRPELVWLHAASDLLIGIAFCSIPVALALLARRRRALSTNRFAMGTIGLVALLALASGVTHLLSAWTIWSPDHGTAGLAKMLAAALAALAAALLWIMLPRLGAMPSLADLTEANRRLTREISERREAERRACRSEARLGGIFEHLNDAVFVLRDTPAGSVFETVNPAFCRIVGAERGRIEGAGPQQVLGPEAAAELQAQCAACLATGAARDWEGTTAGPDGLRLHHYHAVLVPLPADAGADGEARLLGSLREVTELRRLQTDLVETARRATIGAMCAGVAHEMSQPVNIIGLWADRARALLEPGMSRPRRAMEVVLDQTRRLGTLLERMRDLARDAPADAEAFDAAAAVDAAVEVARRAWALDGIEMAIEPHAGAPVRGRPAQLEQAVLHLLENARDAVLQRRRQEPDSPARIAVSVAAGATPGSVTIAVRDTGGGVPAAIAAEILDPFVTTKDPGQGTGLGLPLTVGIVRGMGGRLSWANWAEGRPEAGAVFRLILPMIEPEAAAAAATASAAA
ncbi:MAG: ATP-binding protein [Paracraurococcus sp.]